MINPILQLQGAKMLKKDMRKTRITFLVTEAENDKIKELARDNNMVVSDLIRETVLYGLKNERK